MFILFFILACFPVQASIQIPSTFIIDAPAEGSNQTLFAIKKDNVDIAYIFRFLKTGTTTTYYLFDSKNHLTATAKAISSDNKKRVVFEISDNKKIALGTVEETWNNKTLFRKPSIYPSMQLYSRDHELVAKAKFAPSEETITLFDPKDGHILAVASRQNGSWVYDLQWSLEIDPQLFLFFTCLATDAFRLK